MRGQLPAAWPESSRGAPPRAGDQDVFCSPARISSLTQQSPTVRLPLQETSAEGTSASFAVGGLLSERKLHIPIVASHQSQEYCCREWPPGRIEGRCARPR